MTADRTARPTGIQCLLILGVGLASVSSILFLLLFVFLPFAYTVNSCRGNLVARILSGDSESGIIDCASSIPTRLLLDSYKDDGVLVACVQTGRHNLLTRLLRIGADPNGRFLKVDGEGLRWINGRNPLQVAVLQMDANAIRVLKRFGADPTFVGVDGESARDAAERLGYNELRGLLD